MMNGVGRCVVVLLGLTLLGCDKSKTSSANDQQLAMLYELKSHSPKSSLYHIPVSENIDKMPCPKLLPISAYRPMTQFDDKMRSHSCDYYVYPKLGQFLWVDSSHPNISAQLISPVSHDFQNGAIEANDLGRYVVRLTRKYHFAMSDSLSHSLTVMVSDEPLKLDSRPQTPTNQ